MEMKDKLKKLRQEKGLTQAQLAEALFVSRSTVAKWENGLGLPNPESMEALKNLYGISQEEVSTTAPEEVIVVKNKKLHLIGQIVLWVVIFSITILMAILPFAIHNGSYGFTSATAAGVSGDSTYIDTGNYRLYYSTFSGQWEDGTHWEMLGNAITVKKHFWGWTVAKKNEDYTVRVITKDNYVVGRLISIEGKNGYYNIIGINISPTCTDLVTLDTVKIRGVEYEVEQGFCFVTPEEVTFFHIGDTFYNIEP